MVSKNSITEPVGTSERASAHALRKNAELRVVNGRLVGPTINDPNVKKRLGQLKTEQRKDPAKARDAYVKRGLITQGGKLTKAYGG